MEPTGQEMAPIPHPPFTLQEQVIASGMLTRRNTTVEYAQGPNGQRLHNIRLDNAQVGNLTEQFRTEPTNLMAIARNNVRSIMQDQAVPESERIDRVRRYTDALLSLNIKLDRRALSTLIFSLVL